MMVRRGDGEQVGLALLGLVALTAVGASFWQQRRPPLTISGSPPTPARQAAQWDEALRAAQQVDVNTAGVAALERLPEVGPALARRIVEYRDAHGPFLAPEELTRVPGIGPKTYEALEEYITTK